MTEGTQWTSQQIVAFLWAAVLLEILSPIPALLSLGTIYVLLARPPWFLRAVETLYGR